MKLVISLFVYAYGHLTYGYFKLKSNIIRHNVYMYWVRLDDSVLIIKLQSPTIYYDSDGMYMPMYTYKENQFVTVIC